MNGIFDIDWNHDGQVDIVEDVITADMLGLFGDVETEGFHDMEEDNVE